MHVSPDQPSAFVFRPLRFAFLLLRSLWFCVAVLIVLAVALLPGIMLWWAQVSDLCDDLRAVTLLFIPVFLVGVSSLLPSDPDVSR